MKRKTTISLISGVAIAAIISGVAISTHLRLSATEGQEHGNETPQEIANEILTGQPAHPEQNEKNDNINSTSNTTTPAADSHSESEETLEERAAEEK
jgi:archaellin